MLPSVKEATSFIVFHNYVNVIIYSDSLSSADDPLMIIQLMIERRRSTGGAYGPIQWSVLKRIKC